MLLGGIGNGTLLLPPFGLSTAQSFVAFHRLAKSKTASPPALTERSVASFPIPGPAGKLRNFNLAASKIIPVPIYE